MYFEYGRSMRMASINRMAEKLFMIHHSRKMAFRLAKEAKKRYLKYKKFFID